MKKLALLLILECFVVQNSRPAFGGAVQRPKDKPSPIEINRTVTRSEIINVGDLRVSGAAGTFDLRFTALQNRIPSVFLAQIIANNPLATSESSLSKQLIDDLAAIANAGGNPSLTEFITANVRLHGAVEFHFNSASMRSETKQVTFEETFVDIVQGVPVTKTRTVTKEITVEVPVSESGTGIQNLDSSLVLNPSAISAQTTGQRQAAFSASVVPAGNQTYTAGPVTTARSSTVVGAGAFAFGTVDTVIKTTAQLNVDFYESTANQFVSAVGEPDPAPCLVGSQSYIATLITLIRRNYGPAGRLEIEEYDEDGDERLEARITFTYDSSGLVQMSEYVEFLPVTNEIQTRRRFFSYDHARNLMMEAEDTDGDGAIDLQIHYLGRE